MKNKTKIINSVIKKSILFIYVRKMLFFLKKKHIFLYLLLSYNITFSISNFTSGLILNKTYNKGKINGIKITRINKKVI